MIYWRDKIAAVVSRGVVYPLPLPLHWYFKRGWFDGDLGLLAEAVGLAWRGPIPTTELPVCDWVEMFHAASEFFEHPQPPGDGSLYRGCHPDFQCGMSWSDNWRVAKAYRTRSAQILGEGQVYTTVGVDRSEVLAYFSHQREYVVDPRRLVVISPVGFPVTRADVGGMSFGSFIASCRV